MLVASKVTASTTASGATIQPTRNPVIAWLFDIDPTTIVRSAIPGRLRGDRCSPAQTCVSYTSSEISHSPWSCTTPAIPAMVARS